MNRRRFLVGGLSVLAVPGTAAAQPLPRVGYLFSFTRATGEHLWTACRGGLRDLGYVERQTISLEPRWAAGDHDRLPDLVAELLALRVDVLVTAATPASVAARKATTTTPIVIVAVAEPMRAGLVKSLARPGGNVTGLTLLTPELSGKRLEFLSHAVRTGSLRRVAVLMNPANFSHTVFLEETRTAAQRTGTELHAVTARTVDDVATAFEAAARAQADAMIVFDDPVLWSARADIVRLAAQRRLP